MAAYPDILGLDHTSRMQAATADDVVQNVLLTLASEMPHFVHNQRTGAFRAWLRKILVHRLRRHFQERQRRQLVAEDTWAIQKRPALTQSEIFRSFVKSSSASRAFFLEALRSRN